MHRGEQLVQLLHHASLFTLPQQQWKHMPACEHACQHSEHGSGCKAAVDGGQDVGRSLGH
jgi:hypothetical protein